MLTEILEVEKIRYMRSHNSGNIHAEIYRFERSNEKKTISRKLKHIFTKKLHHNYMDILGYKI